MIEFTPLSRCKIVCLFSGRRAISALALSPTVRDRMIGQDGHVWYSKAGECEKCVGEMTGFDYGATNPLRENR